MIEINIIGGGIAGLSAAHILSRHYRNVKINVYEQEEYLGGKVGMTREDGLLQEHAPRIFSDNYINFYNLMKEIKINKTETVYDKLTEEIKSYIIPKEEDKEALTLTIPNVLKEINFFDTIVLGLILIRGLMTSTERLEKDYDKIRLIDVLYGGSTKRFIEKLSYIIGENLEVLSIYRIYKLLEYDVKRFFGEYPEEKKGTRTFTDSLDKVIFENWERNLIKRGVKIYKGHKLKYIGIHKNKVSHLSFTTSSSYITRSPGDYTILALNIESLSSLYEKIQISEESKNQIRTLEGLTSNYQPGIQIYFKDKIETKRKGTFMIDSDWKLIISPLDNFWENPEETINNEEVKGIWSINIANTDLYSNRLLKRVNECTEEEIKEEIWNQIQTSNINQYIDIDMKVIKPYEILLWKGGGNYFWNSINTADKRPEVITEVDNLFLGGSIIKTNYYSYYVEGAVESAYRVINEIIKQRGRKEIEYYTHERPVLFSLIQYIDSLLFRYKLPSIFDCIVVTFVVILIFNIKI